MFPQNADFFIYIGVKKQLIQSVSQNISAILSHREKFVEGRFSGCRDIWDGKILRKMITGENNVILSLLLNTDGASANKSNQYTFWPIQLVQNHLPPEIRYKTNNIIVCGLYYGKKTPRMSHFFFAL